MNVGPIDPQAAVLQRLLLATGTRVPSPAFAALTADPALPAQQSTLVTPPSTSVQMLVAIAAATPEDNRRRVLAEADRGLTALERFHAVRRLGRPSVEQVHEIAAWARTRTVPDEPAAAKLLHEVELRVLVELAKFERPD